MSSNPNPQGIRIGLIAGEPIRLEGLRVIFEHDPAPGLPPLLPVIGTLQELLSNPDVDYLVVDLNSSEEGLRTLEEVRRVRPGIRQIVIGPEAARGAYTGRHYRRCQGLPCLLGGTSDRSPGH